MRKRATKPQQYKMELADLALQEASTRQGQQDPDRADQEPVRHRDEPGAGAAAAAASEAAKGGAPAAGRIFEVQLEALATPRQEFSWFTRKGLIRGARDAKITRTLPLIHVWPLENPAASDQYRITGGDFHYYVAQMVGLARVRVGLRDSRRFDTALAPLLEVIQQKPARAPFWERVLAAVSLGQLLAERVECHRNELQNKALGVVTGKRKEELSGMLRAYNTVVALNVALDEPALRKLRRDDFRLVCQHAAGGETEIARRICKTGRLPRTPFHVEMELEGLGIAKEISSGVLQISIFPASPTRCNKRLTRRWMNALLADFQRRQSRDTSGAWLDIAHFRSSQ